MVENELASGRCLNDKNNMLAACMEPNGDFVLHLKKNVDGTASEVNKILECKCSVSG